MARVLQTGEVAREGLAKGIELLYTAVGSTLGPKGHTVIIEDQFFGAPVITKDGVTVARNFSLENQVENLGVDIVKQVAAKTDELVGDGTTTATVLAYNIYNECIKYIKESPDKFNEIRESLKEVAEDVISKIDRDTEKNVTDDEVYSIAMISSNGDEEISKIITEAFKAVHKDGSVTIDESKTIKTELKVSSGMEFLSGYLSPYFVNKPADNECVLKNCMVLLCSTPLVDSNEVLPAMTIAKQNNKSLLVIAPNIVSDALAALISNKIKGILDSCAIKLPGFHSPMEMLNDLSVITGAKILSMDGTTPDMVVKEQLGLVNTVVITGKTTTIVDSGVDKKVIDDYILKLRSNSDKLHTYELPGFEKRISRLSSGVATILVGGQTELEVKERKDRVDDATFAVKAALDGGTVIGGGRELYNISKELNGNSYGENILRIALRSPFNLMMKNAYLNPDDYEFSGNEGLDIRSMTKGNLREMGILDPAKVTKSAFKNAISIVDVLLSTDVVMLNTLKSKTPLSDKLYS